MVMVHKFSGAKDECPEQLPRQKLGQLLGHAIQRGKLWRGEHLRAHPADDRRGAPHAGLATWATICSRPFPMRRASPSPARRCITERHGEQTDRQALRRVHRHLQADGRRGGRGDAADPLRRPHRRHRAARTSTAFDQAFEDLFRDRGRSGDLLAIKKKYGATGDILEAEKRIGAIARDLVDHYIDNILPNGFKAQVVCHSKLAAVRYQTGIARGLARALEREQGEGRRRTTELIRRIAFLKAAVVVSSDATNEAGGHHRGAQGGQAH